MKNKLTRVHLFPIIIGGRKKLFIHLMRTLLLLFCTSVFSLSSVDILSQNAKVVIDKDQTISVDEVFDLIKKQTKYTFIYRTDLFKDYPKIILKKGTIKANKLLAKSLSGGDFVFELSQNNAIVITEKPIKIAQQQTVSGKVTDENSEPLPGVTVLMKGTNIGTSTDFDGNFSIDANPGDVLSFSFVGYATQEITITDNITTLDITLTEDKNILDEVVLVSTGYQEISRERATGAFESIRKNQIEKPSSSISERLVGMVAGLQSTTNADGSIDFQIRGQSSLFADQQPLIVYDGFPIEGGFETINPNDVESITVLKDAAAASIWGAKSANGVIVITSKKAKEGKANINFSSFVKMSTKLDLDYTVASASASDIIAYEQKAFDTNFFDGLISQPPGANISSISDPFSLAIVAMNEARLGRISISERDAKLAQLANMNNQSQIENHLLQAPITKQYNLSVSGGSDKMKNNLSLLFEDSKNYFQGNKLNKYLINYRNKIKVTNVLDFEFSGMMQYTDAKRNGTNLGVIRSLAPWDMLVNDDGTQTDLSYLKYYKPNFDLFVPTEKFPYADWSYNPITEINNRDISNVNLNSRIQAGLTLDLIEGLKISSKIQYEIFKDNNESYYSDKTFAVRQFVNETSEWDQNFNTVPSPNVPNGGVLRKNESTVRAYNFRNQISFNRDFAKKHTVNFIAGTELSDRVIEYTRNPDAFGYNDKTLSTSELLNPIQGSSMWSGYPLSFARYFYPFNITPTHSYSENTARFFSVFGNLGYTFDDKYSITGSYRTDASNLITDDPKFRYNPFWSVGVGWSIENEDFMNNIGWVDRLNLRATYGFNGNVDRSTSFKPLISLNPSNSIYTGETTASISSYGNPTLRWEKTNTVNVGVDFTLFDGKLFGVVDVYNKKSFDLIVEQSIASVNGTTSQKFNNGKMFNKGIELTLGTNLPLKGNDIIWSGSVNYAYNKNKITEFFKTNYAQYDLYGGPTTSYVEDFNANTLWSFRYAGMMNVGTEANPILKPSVYGDDGEQIVLTTWSSGNAVDFMEPQGTTIAPTIMGMRHAFKIYNFDLSFIVTAKFGHVFRRQSFNYPAVTGGNTQINKQYTEVVNSSPNDVLPIPDSEPRYYFYDRFYPYLSYLTEDASHIRFQEINLSYSLPRKLNEKLNIDSFKVFLQANNVGVIKFNDFGEDPEFPVGNLRPQAAYTFGINFNF